MSGAGDELAALRAELERVREESRQRWEAVGRLAPAAKASRERAETAERRLAEARTALADVRAALEAGGVVDDERRRALTARIDLVLGHTV